MGAPDADALTGRLAVTYLALQLKARMEGIPTPVYGLQEVYHVS